MKLYDEDREKKVVNDAIQYWRGFSDALEWFREADTNRIDSKIIESKEMIEEYRDRLSALNRKTIAAKKAKVRKNARRNKRS